MISIGNYYLFFLFVMQNILSILLGFFLCGIFPNSILAEIFKTTQNLITNKVPFPNYSAKTDTHDVRSHILNLSSSRNGQKLYILSSKSVPNITP